ncbi:tyrosine-type recombinase/integrase [Magnetovibrio blakemorei]|nr:site-specific integrase [Magnetovibrio blakemorei]
MSTKVHLTKSMVKGALSYDREYFLWDTDVNGFGLRVRPGGSRRYVYFYRPWQGKQRRMTIGDADGMTLEDARTIATKLAGRVADGEDPAQSKRVLKAEMAAAALEIEAGISPEAERTFGELADLMMKRRDDFAASTRDNYTRWIRLYIKPHLGDIKADAIQTSDMQKMIDAVKGQHPTTARRLRDVCAAVIKWASETEDWGTFFRNPELPNPTKRLKVPSPNLVENAMEVGDVKIVWRVLGDLEAKCTDDVRSEALALIRMALLTGARKDELRLLKPHHVDLIRGTITLQRHEHKTGKQIKRGSGAKIIVLPAAAIEVIQSRVQDKERRYVFHGKKRSTAMGAGQPWKTWQSVLTEARKDQVFRKGTIRFHDIRHSFASIGLSQGLGLTEIGALLGHTDYRTTERYAHHSDDSRHAAAAKVADVILT